MTDKELLEMAAKAAGIEIRGPATKFIASGVTDLDLVIRNDRGGDSVWNPLTDDGDALRLAVKLQLCVDIGYAIEFVGVLINGEYVVDVKQGDDPYAATRRAIVRAAAELGKTSVEIGKNL